MIFRAPDTFAITHCASSLTTVSKGTSIVNGILKRSIIASRNCNFGRSGSSRIALTGGR
jgi:hypothetical protein